MWVEEAEVKWAINQAWLSGMDVAYQSVINQCDILLASGEIRDPLALKAVRDWCEMVKLELAVRADTCV